MFRDTSCTAAPSAAALAAEATAAVTAEAVAADDGTSLRSGEPVAAGVRAAVNAGAASVLVNCSRPEATAAALPALTEAGLPFGAYANGFVGVDTLQPGGTVDALRARGDLDPEAYADHALGWVAAGARIIGGCCEIGPDHIAALALHLAGAGWHLAPGPER